MINAAVAACLLVSQSKVLTYEDLNRHMHEAYRKLEDFRQFVVLTNAGRPGTTTIDKRIAGERSRLAVKIDGQPVMDMGYDGGNKWLILHGARVYGTEPGKNEEFSMSFEQAGKKAIEPGSFEISMTDAYNFRFDANPPLKILSQTPETLDGKRVLKFVSQSNKVDGTGSITLAQWMDPNRWVLVRFDLDVKSKAGSQHIVGVSKELDYAAKLSVSDFQLDLNSLRGYRAMSLSELLGRLRRRS